MKKITDMLKEMSPTLDLVTLKDHAYIVDNALRGNRDKAYGIVRILNKDTVLGMNSKKPLDINLLPGHYVSQAKLNASEYITKELSISHVLMNDIDRRYSPADWGSAFQDEIENIDMMISKSHVRDEGRRDMLEWVKIFYPNKDIDDFDRDPNLLESFMKTEMSKYEQAKDSVSDLCLFIKGGKAEPLTEEEFYDRDITGHVPTFTFTGIVWDAPEGSNLPSEVTMPCSRLWREEKAKERLEDCAKCKIKHYDDFIREDNDPVL